MYSGEEKKSQTGKYFPVSCLIANLLVIAASAFWWVSMWRLRNPSPYADDFDSCLTFLSDWVQTRNPDLLLGVHNESSQLLLRSLVLLNYWLTNKVSFSFLTACSITTPVIFVLLLGCYLHHRLKLPWRQIGLCLLPVVFLTLQPGTWGSYLWVTSGLTHGVMPLLMLAGVFAFESRRHFLGISLSFLAFFCGGAGIFFPFILLGIYASSQARIYRFLFLIGLVALAVVAILCLALNPLLLKNFREFFGQNGSFAGMVQYTLAFAGNAVHFQNAALSIASGAAAIMLFALTRPTSAPALFGVGAITICAGIASAILRYPGGGLAHALLSRYEVYATSFWAALYALCLVQFPHRRKISWVIATAIAGSVAITNYVLVPKAILAHHKLQNRDFVFARFDPTIVLAEYPPRTATDGILNRARSLGIFESDPTDFFDSFVERNVPLPQESAPIAYGIDLAGEDSSFLAVRGWSVIRAREIFVPRKICLLVSSTENPSRNFRLCLPKQKRADAIPLVEPEARSHLGDDFGFSLIFPKALLPAGSYRAGLMLAGKKNWHLVWLPADISIKHSEH